MQRTALYEGPRRRPGRRGRGGRGGGQGAAVPDDKGIAARRPFPPSQLPGRAAARTHVVYHDGLVRYHVVGLHGEDPPQPPVREQQPSLCGACAEQRRGAGWVLYSSGRGACWEV